jgi:hypothetical protein
LDDEWRYRWVVNSFSRRPHSSAIRWHRCWQRPSAGHQAETDGKRDRERAEEEQIWDLAEPPLKAVAPVEALVAVGANAGSDRRHGGLCCGMDNIFVERLWRSLKYQEVYAYANVAEAKA